MVHWYLYQGHCSCCGSLSIIPALLSIAAAELDQYIGAATVIISHFITFVALLFRAQFALAAVQRGGEIVKC